MYKLICLTAMTLLLAEGCTAPPPKSIPPPPNSPVIPSVPAVPLPSPTGGTRAPTPSPPAPTPSPLIPSPPILTPTPTPIPSPVARPTAPAGPNEIVGILEAKLPYDYGSGEAMSETMRNLVKDKVFTIEAYSIQPFYGVVKRTHAKIGEPFRIKDIPLNTAMQLDISTPWVSFSQGQCKADAVFVSKTQSFILTGQPLPPIELRVYETLASQYQFPDACKQQAHMEWITFNGKSFDDTNAPLDGVKITARSLNASVPYIEETITGGGAFRFNRAPGGIQVEITASKPGFTTRKRVEVLRGDNRYDFGSDGSTGGSGSINNALSDKPELIKVIPDRNSSGIAPNSPVILTFSEPMDKKTVENTFSVRAFASRQLSIDSPGNTTVPCVSNPSFTLCGDSQVTTVSNQLLWDKSAFNLNWNNDDTVLTLTFKPGYQWPSDKDQAKVPVYQVTFNDTLGNNGRLLKDKSGISRANNHFKLTDGPFEESYLFAVKPDTTPPQVAGLSLTSDAANDPLGDAIQVQFSETMRIPIYNLLIAGGKFHIPGSEAQAPAGYPGATHATERQAAKNYHITITQPNSFIRYSGSWFSLGGTATYGTAPNHAVWLLPPTNTAGADVLNLNVGNVASLPGTYLTDNTVNGPGVGEYTVSLVKPDGSLQPFLAPVKLADNLADNQALAVNFQTVLNQQANTLTVAPSNNPFVVTAGTPTDGSLTVTFNDTSGQYIGWKQTGLTPGNGGDVLPSFAATGVTYTQNRSLNLFSSGDQVQVTVAETVVDPAGNSMTSDQRTTTGTVP